MTERSTRRELWRARLRALATPAFAWDMVMVGLATLNLYLIVWDFAFLWIRPLALDVAPALVELYDPVKGIVPHPVTTGILEAADDAREAIAANDASALASAQTQLVRLSRRMIEEDPFAISAQSRSLVLITRTMAETVYGRPIENPDHLSFAERSAVAEIYWTGEDDVRVRLDLFDRTMRPLLEANFSRQYGIDGRFDDHFWKLDLPFLLLFIVEFVARWGLSMRRREYARWYLFPIFHWYDVLGMIPTKHLRVFRLFRIAAIYIRLRRSGVSIWGRDIITRVAEYFYGIIAEEVSDMVALRILQETQDEVRDGTHVHILARTLGPRRDEIERVVARQIREAVARGEVQARLRSLLRPGLERAVDEARSIRSIPLPDSILRPLVIGVGETVIEDFIHTITATVDSVEGARQLEGLVGSVIDALTRDPVREEVEYLGREIAIAILEEMKSAVRVKKWAQG